MNINQSIADWIENDHNFQQGIRILSLITPGHHWEKYRGSHFAPFQEKSNLKKELISHYDENDDQRSQVKTTLLTTEKEVEIPESILMIKQKNKKLHGLNDKLHSELSLIKSKGRRYEIARIIMMEIIPELNRNYNMIREWERSGKEPPTAEMEVIKDTVQKSKQILSLTPRISKLKRWVKEAKTIEEKEKHQAELEEKEKTLAELKIELGW